MFMGAISYLLKKADTIQFAYQEITLLSLSANLKIMTSLAE
jgi:hypothetical protein